jgi:hypothetical protein
VAVAALHDQMGEASAHGIDDHVGDLADGTVGGFDGHALGEPDRDAAAGTNILVNDCGLINHGLLPCGGVGVHRAPLMLAVP